MKNRLSAYIKIFFSLVVVTSLFFNTEKIYAATMSLRSSPAKVVEGATFVIGASVDTQGKTINNAEANIKYPTDLVEVVSLNAGASIFTLWAEGPSFSNSSGIINFNGGIANPGYTGSAGQVLLVTFRAKKTGNASITLSGTAIRENDGLGTNIFSGQSNTLVEIVAKPVEQTPPEKPVVPEKPVEPTTPDEEEVSEEIETDEELDEVAPGFVEITYFSPSIAQGEQMVIEGTTTYPNATALVTLKTRYGSKINYEILTDARGKFVFNSEPILGEGVYEVSVSILNTSGGVDSSSEKIAVKVSPVTPSVTQETLQIPLVPAITVSLIVLLAMLNLFTLYKFLKLRNRYSLVEARSQKLFKLLITRANTQIALLEKAKRGGSASSRDSSALKELKEVLGQLENFDT